MRPTQAAISEAIAGFGMDTITLAGPLEAKLAAMKAAGFSQVMLKANDINGHPGGIEAAVAAVKASGLRGTGFQVLRDFEGLSGHLHHYKVDIAKGMLATVPAGRFAEPAEVAAAIAFLASPAAAYVNGINLPVDGGRTKSL